MIIYASRYDPVTIPDVSIAEMILEGLDRRGDRAAMIDGPTGRALTGTAVADGIRRLAGGLAARGIGRGRTVALMAPNLPEYAIVFHGAIYAGATVTTINPTYTVSEVRHQLNDAQAQILVTVGPFLETARAAIEGTGVTELAVIGPGEGALPLSALMAEPLGAQVATDLAGDVAVLPYSSGTTGLPKGVMLTNRNLVANIAQIEATMPITEDETGLAVLPFFHIYGMQVAMNLYLKRAASVITMPRFDLEQFLRLAAENRVERLYVAPPIVGALAKHPVVDRFDLSDLKMVLSGAAPLGGEVAEAAAARLGCEVFQGYGMTEMSPVTHFCRIGNGRRGSAGETVSLTECRVIDTATGDDVDEGGTGEILIRGPQGMKGYLNNPAATAHTVDADGWLHTGDIGRFDADGFLYVVDRVKELIKYKGFQVAPAELEALLLTHPDVMDAAVIGRPDDEAGEVPVAFVVPRPGANPDPAAIIDFVAARTATYKRLAQVDWVEAVPKSASGKILRRILKDQLAVGRTPPEAAASPEPTPPLPG